MQKVGQNPRGVEPLFRPVNFHKRATTAEFCGQAKEKKDAERFKKDIAKAQKKCAEQIAKVKAKNGDDVKVRVFAR